MSIQELRAQITKLDTEIGSQRALLRKLERDRSLTQRRLNTILDPMSRLPLEISSEIFLQTLAQPGALHIPGALHGPMLLLSVCNTWTDIALATAALWTTMRIAFPCTRHMKKVVLTWLERARNRPLSISLQGTFDQDVVGIIWEHGQQLKQLEISEMEDARVINALWEGTGPGPLSLLEKLILRGRNADDGLSSREIFQLLRLAPNLTECHFVNVHNLHDFDTGEILVLSRLRRLAFGAGILPDPVVLDHLSLPHLEALVITATSTDLLAFLKRSSPPLRELALGKVSYFPDIVECLHLLPNLRWFEVLFLESTYVMEQIFAAFIESPSLLPHLDTFVLHLDEEDLDFIPVFSSFWEDLNRVLIAWRTQLKGFHLILPYKLLGSQMPAPEVITSLRELAVDGLHVQLTAIADQWDYTFD
ncbi:hypothetical protein DFH08DRAFT_467921 [Mycena albidolilacea]|uniref:F-box domain-containing protein n=1 Tax=Mycena albidolilacea TaxID=1033008 RepID=A0AAD7AEW8_9AGAR|nr:hypothetical protein DFH08DRAFT_467921 [Mycena albidolilacea]